jgi:hypothetical protein
MRTSIGIKLALFPFVAVIGGIFMTPGTDAFSQSATTAVAIGKMEIDRPPADFKFARTGQGGPSRWIVVDDPTSFSKRVIEQSSTDRTDYRLPLAIFEPIVAKNVEISVSFKPVAGRVDQAGGIAVRVLDADNYYVVRANALENNVDSTTLLRGAASKLAVWIPRLPATRGIRLGSKRKMIGSRSAKRYSRHWTRHSPKLERWRFGPSPTA